LLSIPGIFAAIIITIVAVLIYIYVQLGVLKASPDNQLYSTVSSLLYVLAGVLVMLAIGFLNALFVRKWEGRALTPHEAVIIGLAPALILMPLMLCADLWETSSSANRRLYPTNCNNCSEPVTGLQAILTNNLAHYALTYIVVLLLCMLAGAAGGYCFSAMGQRKAKASTEKPQG